jgi:hypothetical protein
VNNGEPAFTARGGWWQRRRLQARLRQLWRLATGREHERVTAPQLWRLQRELDELRTGWERGAWSILPPLSQGSPPLRGGSSSQ